MKYIITCSSGKDSEATLMWAKNNLQNFEVVFCDTKWEDNKVYEHNIYLENWLGKSFINLVSKKYPGGFIDLCIAKKRVASTKARFCTEELKTKPMIDYILLLQDDVTILQGVRNDESEARRHLKEKDEYFKFYNEPFGFDKNNKPKFHTYRKKEVLSFLNKYSVDVFRPIIKWSAEDVFKYIFDNNLKPNPLYFEGFSRIGCFPCIMCRHAEIRLIAEKYPERIDAIRNLENIIGRILSKM